MNDSFLKFRKYITAASLKFSGIYVPTATLRIAGQVKTAYTERRGEAYGVSIIETSQAGLSVGEKTAAFGHLILVDNPERQLVLSRKPLVHWSPTRLGFLIVGQIGSRQLESANCNTERIG